MWRSKSAKAGLTWRVDPDLTDERLAFLAAKDAMKKHSRPRFLTLWRIITVGGGRMTTRGMALSRSGGMYLVSDYAQDLAWEAFEPYVIACDKVAAGLSQEERRILRGTGELPAWFLPDVYREAKRVKTELAKP
jgi:hypothetical protein